MVPGKAVFGRCIPAGGESENMLDFVKKMVENNLKSSDEGINSTTTDSSFKDALSRFITVAELHRDVVMAKPYLFRPLLSLKAKLSFVFNDIVTGHRTQDSIIIFGSRIN